MNSQVRSPFVPLFLSDLLKWRITFAIQLLSKEVKQISLCSYKRPLDVSENYARDNLKAHEKKNEGDLQNFTPTASAVGCKLCTLQGHSMNKCTIYHSYEARVERCKKMRLCTACASSKQEGENCPGLYPFSVKSVPLRHILYRYVIILRKSLSLHAHVYQ